MLPSSESRRQAGSKLFRCALCGVDVSSARNFEEHIRGRRHQAAAERASKKYNPRRKSVKSSCEVVSTTTRRVENSQSNSLAEATNASRRPNNKMSRQKRSDFAIRRVTTSKRNGATNKRSQQQKSVRFLQKSQKTKAPTPQTKTRPAPTPRTKSRPAPTSQTKTRPAPTTLNTCASILDTTQDTTTLADHQPLFASAHSAAEALEEILALRSIFGGGSDANGAFLTTDPILVSFFRDVDNDADGKRLAQQHESHFRYQACDHHDLTLVACTQKIN